MLEREAWGDICNTNSPQVARTKAYVNRLFGGTNALRECYTLNCACIISPGKKDTDTANQSESKISSNSLMHQLKKKKHPSVKVGSDCIKEGGAHLGSRISLATTCVSSKWSTSQRKRKAYMR